MIYRIIYTMFVVLLAMPVMSQADDYYVITGTNKAQKAAQQVAALKGGWVLNTGFYSKLTPNLYAVVRGPFKTKSEATTQLVSLMSGGRYPGSYVKNAGSLNVDIKIGNKSLSPQMLAALLGELRIDISENKGASKPCEPQEPYKQISLSYVTVARAYDDKQDKVVYMPQDVDIYVGGFWQINRTGQVERMRVCAE